MPKGFGKTTRIVVGSLVLGSALAGCRTTTSKLASVPGMGWLDRGEESFGEGWAGYEPAPVPPSQTSEPTNSGPGAGLASSEGLDSQSPYSSYRNLKNGASSPDSALAQSKDRLGKSQLGTAGVSRYSSAKDTVAKAKDKIGGYGSAYGPYAPGAGSSSSKSSLTQQGPYSVASTPATGASSSGGSGTRATTGEFGRFGATSPAATSTPAGAPTDRFAASNRFGAGDTAAATDFSDTSADRTSRFGTPLASKPASSGNSTYTPPGFPSVASAEKAAGKVANRFAEAGNSMADSASRFGQGLEQSTANHAQSLASQPGSLVNQYVASTQDSLSDAARQVQGQATNAINNVASTSKASDYLKAAQDALNGVDEASTPDGAGLGGYAAQAKDRFSNAVQGTVGPATEQVQSYADAAVTAAQDRFGQAQSQLKDQAQSYVDTATDAAAKATQPAREAIEGYAGGAAELGRKAVKSYESMIPSYPKTSTPDGYLSPNAEQPLKTTPAGFSPGSTIRRSSTPWLPGSTSNLQGSNKRTAFKQEVQLSSATADTREQLVLAVGDKYQFPRELR